MSGGREPEDVGYLANDSAHVEKFAHGYYCLYNVVDLGAVM